MKDVRQRTMHKRHTIFGGMLDFTYAIKMFNWGLIDFLVDVCVILTGIIWGAVHYPVLLKPFLIWTLIGIIVLFFLIAFTIILRRIYTNWQDAKNQHYIEQTKDFKNFDTKCVIRNKEYNKKNDN